MRNQSMQSININEVEEDRNMTLINNNHDMNFYNQTTGNNFYNLNLKVYYILLVLLYLFSHLNIYFVQINLVHKVFY